MIESLETLEARVARRMSVPGRRRVVGASDAAILLTDFASAVLVDPDGASEVIATDERQLISAALGDDGRVALLEAQPSEGRWPAQVRIVDPRTGGEQTWDADVTGSLEVGTGTGGALAWDGPSALWLAGLDDASEELWVGRIDAETGELITQGTFPDPYVESAVRFGAVARGRAHLEVDAGQHGGWVFVAEPGPGAQLSVRSRVPSDKVNAHLEIGADLLGLEVFGPPKLVRWRGPERVELELPGTGFPLYLISLDAGRVMVLDDRGEALLVDSDRMAAVGRLRVPGHTDGGQELTGAAMGSRWVTARYGDGETELALWTLP